MFGGLILDSLSTDNPQSISEDRDPFQANSYSDEVDFYEDHKDDFDCFEDAEDYYFENQ